MKVSVLMDCLRNILNAERAGKKQVMIRPASKVIIKFLRVMQKHSTKIPLNPINFLNIYNFSPS